MKVRGLPTAPKGIKMPQKDKIISKDYGSSVIFEYHLSLGKCDWLTVYDDGNIVNIEFKNDGREETKEVYYSLQIDKESEFFENLVTILRNCWNRKIGKTTTLN